ncbi:MAG: substrate-binding domain-containing protein [Dethiosulfovibrio sp.]|nr:substrate-binding domain-containing protein [Dethiosulfovibrio sp.]
MAGDSSISYRLAILFCDQENPFWQETVKAYEKSLAQREHRVDFLFPRRPLDLEEQSELLAKALSRDYNGIIVNPLTEDNLTEVMASRTGGCPMFDVGPKSRPTGQALWGYVPLYVADFEEQGRLSAIEILKLAPEGPLGCVGGPEGARQGRLRVQGAVEEAGRRAVPVLPTVWEDFTELGGERAAEALILQGARAIFCANDLMALGAIKAAERSESPIAIGGVDGIPEARKAIESGLMASSVWIDPMETVEAIMNSVETFLSEGKTPGGYLTKNIPIYRG